MNRTSLLVFTIAFVLAGCGGGKLPEGASDQAESQLPDDHPPISGGNAPFAGGLGDSGPTDDHALPLKLEGLSSVEELEKGMQATKNEEAREAFASGFRKTFTAKASLRDYAGAQTDLERAIALDPRFAPAYRALGYARFNMGFDVPAAMENYKKAVEIDPEYGEAHYALAFMYVMTDPEAGQVHFDKAMKLGVPDERNLGEKYYGP